MLKNMFEEQKDREKVYSVQIEGQRIDFTLELLDKIKNGQTQGDEIKKVYHLITKDGRIDISKETITNCLSKQIISRQTEDVEKQQGTYYPGWFSKLFFVLLPLFFHCHSGFFACVACACCSLLVVSPLLFFYVFCLSGYYLFTKTVSYGFLRNVNTSVFGD